MTDLNDKTILILSGTPTLDNLIEGISATLRKNGATVRRLPIDSADFGAFDGAIICPGWFAEKPFMETTSAEWSDALSANFEQMVYAGQAVARRLIDQNIGGRIIYLSSVASLKSYAQLSTAGVSLAALNALAKMAAVDLAPYGITVNIVALGWLEGGWATESVPANDAARLAQNIPLERFGTARDVGALCSFLVSDASSYLTGTLIPVDGGYTLTKAGAGTPRKS